MGADIQHILTRKDGTVIVLTPKDKIRQATVITTQDGTEIVVNEDEDKIDAHVTLTCDSPKCQSRHEIDKPVTIEVDEAKAKVDPLSVPETFWQSIKIVPDPRRDFAMWFCSSQCTKDFLTYTYVPPKTPREMLDGQKLTDEAMKAIEAANDAVGDSTGEPYVN